MRTLGIVASLATFAGLALVTTTEAAAQQRPAEGRSEGPIVRRVLSRDDTDPDDFVEMSPSLDGQRVAYVSMSDGSVHVRDLGTGEVRQLVDGVAVINQLPILNPGNNPTVYAADRPPPPPNDRRPAFWRTVLPGYFDAMGIPLLRGRDIEPSDLDGTPLVIVINETMARTLFPGEDPLGKPVNVWTQGENCEVVGVVGDVRLEGTKYTPRMAMYASYLQHPTLTMRLGIRSAIAPTSLATAVRDVVWNHDRDIAVSGLSSMDEIIARKVSSEKIVAISVTMFAAVAVLLALLGLYGVLAYYVNRRSHEIGIRVALGADAQQVILPILSRGLSLVAIGISLGLVGAFWAARVLQRLLFDVAPTDATTFVFVSLLFAVVASVACLLPALRALRVDPVAVLSAQ